MLSFTPQKYQSTLASTMSFVDDLNKRNPDSPWDPRESAVPSSTLSRVSSYATLGIKLISGTITESTKKRLHLSEEQGSSIYSKRNLDNLSATLRRMRGVALKLGQFLSMQDERSLVSQELRDALESARMHADIMPE